MCNTFKGYNGRSSGSSNRQISVVKHNLWIEPRRTGEFPLERANYYDFMPYSIIPFPTYYRSWFTTFGDTTYRLIGLVQAPCENF